MEKKFNRLIVLVIVLMTVSACKKDTPIELNVSKTELTNVSNKGDSFEIEVNSASNWTIIENSYWCRSNKLAGVGNDKIVLTVQPNVDNKTRSTSLTISSEGINKTITVTQQASDGTEYNYKIPVICHVFYTDPTDNTQNVDKGRMAYIIKAVNELYKGRMNTPNMNLEFVMAEKDPEGKTLEEPGVERIFWNEYPISYEYMMLEDYNAFKNYIWDPNEYINIMVYHFAESGILGVSHFPYTTEQNNLIGTYGIPAEYIALDDLNFTYCLSLNSKFIYNESTEEGTDFNDVIVTTAHELGHFLGLYHVFSGDGCVDTDYCNDTPTYNRGAYEEWLYNYDNVTPIWKMEDVVMRTTCDGTPFVSTNIMDYYISYNDQFTPDQKARIRFVLTYGPLIPGPKIYTKQPRKTKGVIKDLPIRVME